MIESRGARYALTPYVLAVLLAGCSGSAVVPGGGGAFAPNASPANKDALLYVTNPYDGTVDVYSYPEDQMVGELSGFLWPLGSCTDKHGNIYITDFNAETVVEYAHGGTQPIRTLPVPGSGPAACAVDRRSGDLAVTTAGTVSGMGANIAIYRHAEGTPKTYTYPKIFGYGYCAYDNAGNLYVDGTPAHGYGYDYELAQLPKNGTALQSINVQYGIDWSAPLQWDSGYLVVGQPINPRIARYSVSGSYAAYVGSTPLSDAYDAFQFILAGKKAIVANLYYYDMYQLRYDVLVYDYPRGGYSTLDMLQSRTGVGSVALSRQPK